MIDMEVLKGLGLDTEEGLAYCADDPEFYGEMLLEYVKESGERLSGLQRFFEERDWQQYTVCAHSVKSTSRMIGAKELSETARISEMAGKEGNTEELMSRHQHFLEAYKNTAEMIGAAIGTEG